MILLNGQPILPTVFPDKTSQVWKINEKLFSKGPYARIEWKFEHEGEFLHLAQLNKLIYETTGLVATLHLPYLPYARQDKPVSNESTFALRSFAELLNSLEFHEVTCVDPHSHIAEELIENFKPIYPTYQLSKTIEAVGSDIVCYPDKGAREKYSKIYPYPYIYGEKVRDQETGNILSYDLIGECKDMKVLIVDDICDFGRTFILLNKYLKIARAKEVNLFVSHGLFSGGIKVLTDAGINRIFTSNGEVDYGR